MVWGRRGGEGTKVWRSKRASPSEGFKGASRGLKGGLKGASRGLEGGLKGASPSEGFKGAWRGRLVFTLYQLRGHCTNWGVCACPCYKVYFMSLDKACAFLNAKYHSATRAQSERRFAKTRGSFRCNEQWIFIFFHPTKITFLTCEPKTKNGRVFSLNK